MKFSIPLHPNLGYSLQASKWQKFPLLIDKEEMQGLFESLAGAGEFWIVLVSGLVRAGEEVVSQKEFLELYGKYIDFLKKGEIFNDPRMRPYFSAALSTFPEAFYAFEARVGDRLVKVQEPVVQMQASRFDYSYADSSFRLNVIGTDAISWGIQLSFPHVIQDANYQVLKVQESSRFPNFLLFKKLQGWIRSHTLPTPFEVEGRIVNVPLRLGKNCFKWINSHPQLNSKGLRVVNAPIASKLDS